MPIVPVLPTAASVTDPSALEARRLLREGHLGSASDLVCALVATDELDEMGLVDAVAALAVLVECQLATGGAAGAAVETVERQQALLAGRSPRAGGREVAQAIVHTCAGTVAHAVGDHERALELFVSAATGPDTPLAPWRLPCAMTLHRLGRRTEARSVAEQQLADARRLGEAEVAAARRVLDLIDGATAADAAAAAAAPAGLSPAPARPAR